MNIPEPFPTTLTKTEQLYQNQHGRFKTYRAVFDNFPDSINTTDSSIQERSIYENTILTDSFPLCGQFNPVTTRQLTPQHLFECASVYVVESIFLVQWLKRSIQFEAPNLTPVNTARSVIKMAVFTATVSHVSYLIWYHHTAALYGIQLRYAGRSSPSNDTTVIQMRSYDFSVALGLRLEESSIRE